MPNRIDIRRFQRSITDELKYTKDRVRNLIGDANWAEEGRYKEAILKKIIRQYLPSNLEIGTGFIVSNSDHINGQRGIISNQLDLLIYEGKTPVIFREGDFVILTESAVRGVIEVKSKMTNYAADPNSNALNAVLNKLNDLNRFETFSNPDFQRRRFIGVFAFDYDGNIDANRIDEALQNSNGLTNHISLGTDIFVRHWRNTEGLVPPLDFNGPCYNIYNLQRLSFSYFISNLLHLTSDEEPLDRYWFSFPIEGTKEIHRRRTIRL
jgi:hypothetical protein